MKKAIVILLMLCATVGAKAQTKVAHINSSELIEAMPEADSIQKKLLKEQEQWQLILSEKEKEAKTKYATLMQIIDDPNVSKSMKEIRTQEVENLQKSISCFSPCGNLAWRRLDFCYLGSCTWIVGDY